MAQARWQPFNPVWGQLQQLQTELNRMFDRWGPDTGEAYGVSSYPPLNVWEDSQAVFVEAELPGLDRQSLEIYVTAGNQLTIKGERKPTVPEKAVCHRQERGFGSFLRVLTLPFEVNRDNVDARFDNGVLTIKLAKAESAKPRKINVKAE